ncbi:MAG: hypothetical protein ACLQQ4_09335 [Bacteroidia bacterium]
MKLKKNYSLLFAVTMLGAGMGTITAQVKQPAQIGVQQISTSKWNTTDGIPYKQGPGINMGAISFEVLSGNKIAYLCNATNEIIITDATSGSAIKKFAVIFAPRDFVYDNGFFYVLNDRVVAVYDDNGNIAKNITFPASYTGVERLSRYGNATYLLLPSGNSLKIEASGQQVEAKEYQGWITQAGYFITTKISGGNSYSFSVNNGDKILDEKSFSTDKKVAGVYVAGATADHIYLDVQTFVTESPISVERHIVEIEYSAGKIGNIVASIKVPDCYYVLSNNDFHLSTSGTLLNMVTAPQGIYVFSVTETKTNATDYPDFILATKYHFNDHLIQVDAK